MSAGKRGLHLVVQREPLDINTVVTHTLAKMKDELVLASIQLSQELHPSLPLLTGVPSALGEALELLIRNSMDSMLDKTRVVRVRTSLVELAPVDTTEIYPPGKGIPGLYPNISVYDTGRGLNELQRRHFFTQPPEDEMRTRNLRRILDAMRLNEAGIKIRSYEDRVVQVDMIFLDSRGITGRRLKAQTP